MAEPQTPSLKDISGHWAEPQIQKAVSAGFVAGYSDGTFKPDTTITGEEFITMMVKALQYPTETPRSGDPWFAPYKQSAINHELYKDDYRSGLDKPITRFEIASTLVRATVQPQYEKILYEKVSSMFSTAELKTKYASYEADKKIIENNPDYKGDITVIEQNPEKVLSELEQALSATKIRDPAKYVTDYNQCTDSYSCGIAGAHFCPNANECYYRVSREQESLERFLKYVQSGVDPIIQTKRAQTSTPNRMVYEAAYRGLMTETGNGELSLHSEVTRAQAVTFINRVLAFNSGERQQTNKYTVAAAEVVWHKTNVMTMAPRYFSSYNNGEFEFDDEGWTSTSINGLASCTTTAFLAIDLDDPNDPNRKWLTADLRWGQYPIYNSFEGVSGYVLLSISELTFQEEPAFYHNSCGISVSNNDWKPLDEPTEKDIDAEKPQNKFSLGVLEQKDGDMTRIKPKLIVGTPNLQVSGYVIPKDFVSKNQFTTYYIPIDNVTGGTPHKLISRSHVNENK